MGSLLAGDTSLPCWAEPGAGWYPDLVHGFIIPGGWDGGGEEVMLLELETKVHPKIRNHGEGPY